MNKMRIYEYAKQRNTTSKEVVNYLKELNMDISNHMSTVSGETITKLDEKFQPKQKQHINVQQTNNDKDNKMKKSNTNSNNNANSNTNEKQNKKNKTQRKQPKNHQNNYKNKKQKGKAAGSKPMAKQPPEDNTPEKIKYQNKLTVSELAAKLHKKEAEIIKKLMFLGVMATKNQDLDDDTIELICAEYNVAVEKEVVLEDTNFDKYLEDDKEEDLVERPAVVTIMGHVDHGKTTLLDSIRDTKVTAGEAGGITQHIGAYQIENDGKEITFLDTPGHAAFTSMRSRGSQITDVAILVVAADDGVMPQTVEAINHAKAAEVPIIVAVNKMDKESANPNRVMQELTEYELVPEDWGGQTIFVNLSAKQQTGIDNLLEMILLVSEVEELKANPNKNAFGTVIEAELDKGRGSVVTLLVQNGTLHVGDSLVVGSTHGRVRAMLDHTGAEVTSADPSTPVEITGLHNVPQAGDQFLVFTDEKKARQIGEARHQKYIEENRSEQTKVSLDDLFEQIRQGEMKDLNIIIKGDVQGSVEALAASIRKIDVEGVNIHVIHSGAGAITESDIILASASNAIVIGFNVRPDANAQKAAKSEKVDIRLHRVIYTAIEEIETAMKGLLDPEYEEKIIGQAEVRETFKVSKVGTIAGCYVTDGKIKRNAGIRLIRDSVVLFEGEIDSLKRYKDDAREVSKNYECGITIVNFNDIKVGDTIEAFEMEEIRPQ